MTFAAPVIGSLLAQDFLRDGITELSEWGAVRDDEVSTFEDDLRGVFESFPVAQLPNESQTEADLIWPVLEQLGWESNLRQQNLSPSGRTDVPDGLLFADRYAKGRANRVLEWQRYAHGVAVVEAKRWLRPLDRRTDSDGGTAPATQMLRYLRRIDDITNGALRWGVLTNGAHWRLYFAGMPSVAEQFLHVDLGAVLNLPGHNDGLFALDGDDERRHWLKTFLILFRREAFSSDVGDGTIHQRALSEASLHCRTVADNLSDVAFNTVFPTLANAVAAQVPNALLRDVRDAALVILYRLLFVLYAEDRGLLPVRDAQYAGYSFRENVRSHVGERMASGLSFSASTTKYWGTFDDLCRVIDHGDTHIGLPPYNGGLFDNARTPMLAGLRLGDETMAEVVDALSFDGPETGRRYVNYRDLGVRQIGAIYERLLGQEFVGDGDAIRMRPAPFLRKDSTAYYTPDDLVDLVIRETIDPLAGARMAAFRSAVDAMPADADPLAKPLRDNDPAERLLDLKVCDPAMGSGHFLVGAVDRLTDLAIEFSAEAEHLVDGYVSPLSARIEAVRALIMQNAEESGWTLDSAQLDDRHIVRRMVLKRCVHGVDKNPMAVELAKVSLWLHTFTAGAPLSFLDHHLRCGDSLFGAWVGPAVADARKAGGIFVEEPLQRAMGAAEPMREIERLSDAEIAQAHRSADLFDELGAMTAPLDSLLSLLTGFDWLNTKDAGVKAARQFWLSGALGDPVEVAEGHLNVDADAAARRIVEQARQIAASERFLNWELAFPGVWPDWKDSEGAGGFDAVIGNPPWDRMKLQQVEWFAARKPAIALAQKAADRKRMIRDLANAGDPLAGEYDAASGLAATAVRTAKASGDYPLLSGGDVNVYSLFVERSFSLLNADGVVGLVVPSGIASDKTAASFFRSVAGGGKLQALYDFENKRPFFPNVDSRFKFCVLVASQSELPTPARCAFYLHNVAELADSDRVFEMTASDFALVNPNTGTAPIFRSRRDAELTTAIYSRLPVLVDRSGGKETKAWPVKYVRMFDMTNDSGLFRTRKQLQEEEGAWRIAGSNRYDSPVGEWLPLYEGKMVQAFDHRAASVIVNPANVNRPGHPKPATIEEHKKPNWMPEPQFWILAENCDFSETQLGFKDVTSPTNMRSMIAALLPRSGAGNTLPMLTLEGNDRASRMALAVANLNAVALDFVVRQKVHGQHLNWFVLEQLPVVPFDRYETPIGAKTLRDVVVEAVLELTYTAVDMADFARDLGHVDEAGDVLPPFTWDDSRRRTLMAKLDAVYFQLYGVTDRDDVRYVYSTFPIVKRQETAALGSYRSRDLCLDWMNALAAGQPDANIG